MIPGRTSVVGAAGTGSRNDGQAKLNAKLASCDMGEGFGLYKMGDDEGLMPHITIANVACIPRLRPYGDGAHRATR